MSKLKEEKTNIPLKLHFADNIDFQSDKTSLGAGKKRSISFSTGPSPQETITAEGMLKSSLHVSVSEGLPNDSRPTSMTTKAQNFKNKQNNLGGQRPVGPGTPLPPTPVPGTPDF